jgi:hypothetical protein
VARVPRVTEVARVPGVTELARVPGPLRWRPIIWVNRRMAVAGFEDGIAVRLDRERAQQVVRIPGCRVLGKGDQRFLRGMVSLPWSAREHWRELARAAIMSVPPR